MKLQEMEPRTKARQREIVSETEWLIARKDLLTREKEFTRQRDALSAARRQLPMLKVDKEYVFDGAPKAKKHWPICSAAEANSSFTTLCSARIGKKDARVARIWPIISMARTGICRIAT
jgi:hypothetical protein